MQSSLKKLLNNDDEGLVLQGVALAESLDDLALLEELLGDTCLAGPLGFSRGYYGTPPRLIGVSPGGAFKPNARWAPAAALMLMAAHARLAPDAPARSAARWETRLCAPETGRVQAVRALRFGEGDALEIARSPSFPAQPALLAWLGAAGWSLGPARAEAEILQASARVLTEDLSAIYDAMPEPLADALLRDLLPLGQPRSVTFAAREVESVPAPLSLEGLEVLDLSGSGVKELRMTPGPGLMLRVQGSKLSRPPVGIRQLGVDAGQWSLWRAHLGGLTALEIEGLTAVPAGLESMPALRRLQLTWDAPASDVSLPFEALSQLTHLSLSMPSGGRLPEAVWRMPRLEQLSLEGFEPGGFPAAPPPGLRALQTELSLFRSLGPGWREIVSLHDRTDVWLLDYGPKKIKVIKAVRAATGLGLKDAKQLVESAPTRVKRCTTSREALALKRELTEVGARAAMR